MNAYSFKNMCPSFVIIVVLDEAVIDRPPLAS